MVAGGVAVAGGWRGFGGWLGQTRFLAAQNRFWGPPKTGPSPPYSSTAFTQVHTPPFGLACARLSTLVPTAPLFALALFLQIGYWRYISIYRHLQRNPDNQLYPLFGAREGEEENEGGAGRERRTRPPPPPTPSAPLHPLTSTPISPPPPPHAEYFENWCQDESRHGDFLAAILKMYPNLLTGFEARLWSRFFTLSVYVTMYLNDHSRTAFYESIGLNTTQFNRHVIIETNKTTERLFPEVPDTEDPAFWEHMEALVSLNRRLAAAGPNASILTKAPILAGFGVHLLALFFGKMRRSGSADVDASVAPVY